MPDQQNILRHNFTSPQLIASLAHTHESRPSVKMENKNEEINFDWLAATEFALCNEKNEKHGETGREKDGSSGKIEGAVN